MRNRDDYTVFKYAAERVENDLKGCFYKGVFERPTPEMPISISAESILSILNLVTPTYRNNLYNFTTPPRFSSSNELLTPMKPKVLPCPPQKPSTPEPSWTNEKWPDWYNTRCSQIEAKIQYVNSDIQNRHQFDIETTIKIKEAYEVGEPSAIETVAKLAITRNPLPEQFCLDVDVSYDCEVRILLATIEIPDFKQLDIFKLTKSYKKTAVSATDRKKLTEYILYALCVRAAYLVAETDTKGMFETVAVNARQNWFDPATGTPCEGIIASFQARKEDLVELQIEKVDPKACFRHFSGIATPSVERVAAVRPIFVMDKNDRRHIAARDIDEGLTEDTNLASMAWDDFEHLVRQLFEWEFGRNGVEVKVTCASRDRGVDAIMYDPDPLRGGKYVLQAKRYTRTVDVSAVRDLYGTVVNEGANRGILVTTSSYGPDAYDFAKGKPISLVDGTALIQMLLKNGRKCRIDLEEARRLERD